MGSIGTILGFRGRTGRLAYLAMVVLLAVGVAGIGPLIGGPGEPSQGLGTGAAAGVALVMAMVLAIVLLNARRLRDAGLSLWWGLFPFVTGLIASPIADDAVRAMVTNSINGAFMLALCLLPPSTATAGQAASDSAPPPSDPAAAEAR